MLTVLFKIGRAIGMQCDLADACKVEILPVHLPALTVNSNKFPSIGVAGNVENSFHN